MPLQNGKKETQVFADEALTKIGDNDQHWGGGSTHRHLARS